MDLIMATQAKIYNITVRGKVQDVNFRDYIIGIANISNIRGYIFNDVDGTVKMVFEGAKDTVNSVLNEIRSRKYVTGVEIESMQQKELTDKFDLPAKFVKLSTDEMWDIDRKLGIGNELLAHLKKDTSMLPAINSGIDSLKTDTSMLPAINSGIDSLKTDTNDIKTGINSLNIKFDIFFEKQNEFNRNIIEHNVRLEKILEKLIEK
jgi:acylphosphatase